jgi:hypothetical protein
LLLLLLRGLRVLLLSLRLLGPLLLLLLRGLRVLLLSLRLLGPLLLRLLLLFLSASLPRVHRDNRPEKQKQGSSTGNSNELHSNLPPLKSPLGVHADDQSASTMFHCLCRFRLGPRPVHAAMWCLLSGRLASV